MYPCKTTCEKFVRIGIRALVLWLWAALVTRSFSLISFSDHCMLPFQTLNKDKWVWTMQVDVKLKKFNCTKYWQKLNFYNLRFFRFFSWKAVSKTFKEHVLLLVVKLSIEQLMKHKKKREICALNSLWVTLVKEFGFFHVREALFFFVLLYRNKESFYWTQL